MRARHFKLASFALVALLLGCEGLDGENNGDSDGGASPSEGAGKLADSIGSFFGGGSNSNDGQSGEEGTPSGQSGDETPSGDPSEGGDVSSGGASSSACQSACADIVGCLVSLCQLPASPAEISAATSECARDCAAEATQEEIAEVNQMTANNCAGLAPYQADICGDFEEDDWEDSGDSTDGWEDSEDVDGPNCDTGVACPAAHCIVGCGDDDACMMSCVTQHCGEDPMSIDENSPCACSDATIINTCGIDPSYFAEDDEEYGYGGSGGYEGGGEDPYEGTETATCDEDIFCEMARCAEGCAQDEACLMACAEVCQPAGVCGCPATTIRQCGVSFGG